jgi:hypothetical protein
MPQVTNPTNYLVAREKYQICKYKLRRTEDELLKNFDVKTIADLETAMVRERSKRCPRFADLTTLYHQLHQDFAEADEIYELASEIQRLRIAEMQKKTGVTIATTN